MSKRRRKKRSQKKKAFVVSRPPSDLAPETDETPSRRSSHRGKLVVALVIGGALAVATWHLLPSLGVRSSKRRPLNVVIVTADTLRADKLGAYGNDAIETPHLDALAERGVLFENAATSAPITLPAHASIFTGTYPIYHGVRDNGGYTLTSDHVTLAESLKKEGYATGAFVGAFVLDSRWGLDQGFDRYFDDFERGSPDDQSLNAVHRRGDEVMSEALAWMESISAGDTRFFVWIHLYDTHVPYDPPEPFASRYRDGPWGAYDGEVAYVDSLVGELVEWLEAESLSDSTLVAFVADHGEALGEHDELTHGFFVYEETMRVPFILDAPYPELEGQRVSAQVRTIDLMPTVLDLVGAEIPPSSQGVSLVDIASGSEDDLNLTAYGESIFPEHYGWSPLASLRTERYHFIEAPRPELYDLESDPEEETNLASSMAATARELQSELAQLRKELGRESSGESARSELDEDTRSRLAALGYMSAGASTASRDPSRPLPDPKDKIGLFKLIREASAEAGTGRVEDAIAKLERVIGDDPDIPEAYNILGNLHRRQERQEKAIAAYREALSRAPNYEPALFGLATLHQDAGRLAEAAAGFERILELHPKASQAAFLLARTRMDEERYREALEVLDGVSPVSDEETAALLNLRGECHLGLDALGEAETAIRHALELESDLPGANYNLGVVFEKRGRREEAVAAYKEELSIDPDSYRAHFNLGKILGQIGRENEMIDHLEKAISKNPGFATGYLYLANAYVELDNLERAMTLARRGLELGPEPALAPLGHFILADAYERMGRRRDAARELAEAQRLQNR